MTGKTHFTIGAAVGAAAAIYNALDPQQLALYSGISAFSALCADLDGPSVLSSKLSKLSRYIRTLALWGTVLFVALIGVFYFIGRPVSPLLLGACAAAVLSVLVIKQGAIRNALVSAAGAALIYVGYAYQLPWLIGFGVFTVIAPWLKHRGLTHTVWAVAAWGAIAWGLEQQLQLKGVTLVAVLGYLSHLIADTLTPSGVKWLYPIVKKSFKFRL